MAKKYQPLFDQDLLTWRQQFSPLRGLTLQRLVLWFQNAEMGYFSDLQWLYRFVEKRDAVLRAVKHRRISAIKKLDWTVKVKEGKEGPDAEAQQEYLTQIYEGIDNLQKAIEFLALGSFRGYAHLEKHYSSDGDIIHLEPVPQWLWCRKLPLKDWLYNPRALQTATGIPIDIKNFIIRECEDPIDEPCAVHFLRKNMSQKDWDGFIETFGIPPIFVELPLGVGTPGNGSGQATEYQILAEKIISDGRGVLPNGAKLATPTAPANHQDPFEKHIRYQDEQIVLAATSGLLTTLTANTGMNGEHQSDEHADAFADLAEAEAGEISEIFQTQIDGPLLNQEFPDQEVLVYFELAAEEVRDADLIKDVVSLATAGYRMDMEQLSEKTGLKLEEAQPGQPGAPMPTGPDGQPVSGGSSPLKSTESSGSEDVPDTSSDDNYPAYMRSGFPFLTNAVRKDFSLLTNAIQSVIDSSDEEIMVNAGRLGDQLPNIVREMNVNPSMVKNIELILEQKEKCG